MGSGQRRGWLRQPQRMSRAYLSLRPPPPRPAPPEWVNHGPCRQVQEMLVPISDLTCSGAESLALVGSRSRQLFQAGCWEGGQPPTGHTPGGLIPSGRGEKKNVLFHTLLENPLPCPLLCRLVLNLEPVAAPRTSQQADGPPAHTMKGKGQGFGCVFSKRRWGRTF